VSVGVQGDNQALQGFALVTVSFEPAAMSAVLAVHSSFK
jgi:hypothetical protein